MKSRGRGTFTHRLRAGLYAMQQTVFHDEHARVDDAPDAPDHHGSGAEDEPGGTVCLGKDDKLPEVYPCAVFLVAHNDGVVGVNLGDFVGRGHPVRTHFDRIANLQILPFGVDAVGVGDGALDGPFQPGVAIPAPFLCADLDKPGINLLRAGLNGDCPIDETGRFCDKFIAGEGHGDFFIGGTPAIHPGREQGEDDDKEQDDTQNGSGDFEKFFHFRPLSGKISIKRAFGARALGAPKAPHLGKFIPADELLSPLRGVALPGLPGVLEKATR